MNTDDRQQHIEVLSWTLKDAWCTSECLLTEAHAAKAMEMAQAVLDSTDPRVHDALTAALHANADRARVLAAHADAGWLDEERPEPAEAPGPTCKECAAGINSACADCGCCNHEWDNDCGCVVKACGCYEARLDREEPTQ